MEHTPAVWDVRLGQRASSLLIASQREEGVVAFGTRCGLELTYEL